VKLSLKWKIAGGFAVLLLLIALLSSVTLSLFTSARDVQRRVFDRAIPALVAADEIVRSFTAQSAAVRGYLISSRPELLAQYRAEVDIAHEWEQRALALMPSDSETAILTALIEAGEAYRDVIDDRVLPLAQRGERSQAFRVLASEGAPLIAEVELLGGELRSAQDQIVRQTEEEVSTRQNQAILILIVVPAVALVMGLALTIFLPRRLVRDLDKLVGAARRIERGDFDQKLDIRSGDEVEELATRVEDMQKGLKRLQQLALQDRELEIAAAIQRNLLQRDIPQAPEARLVPIQRQANRVGGDWYDFDLTGRSLTLVIGDASGKGIAAALMATVALASLRAERALGAEPKRVVESANKALRDATDPDSFTTLIYMSVELSSGELRWMNMGHPAPFILRPTDEGRSAGYFLEGPRNRALGWFEDPGLAETVVNLQRGDRVLLYTDGFVEAKSPEGELFGERRLADAFVKLAPLGSNELGDELVREVEAFAAGKLDDDLTLLILEFAGSPQGLPEG